MTYRLIDVFTKPLLILTEFQALSDLRLKKDNIACVKMSNNKILVFFRKEGYPSAESINCRVVTVNLNDNSISESNDKILSNSIISHNYRAVNLENNKCLFSFTTYDGAGTYLKTIIITLDNLDNITKGNEYGIDAKYGSSTVTRVIKVDSNNAVILFKTDELTSYNFSRSDLVINNLIITSKSENLSETLSSSSFSGEIIGNDNSLLLCCSINNTLKYGVWRKGLNYISYAYIPSDVSFINSFANINGVINVYATDNSGSIKGNTSFYYNDRKYKEIEQKSIQNIGLDKLDDQNIFTPIDGYYNSFITSNTYNGKIFCYIENIQKVILPNILGVATKNGLPNSEISCVFPDYKLNWK